jgi:hypothetical protein
MSFLYSIPVVPLHNHPKLLKQKTELHMYWVIIGRDIFQSTNNGANWTHTSSFSSNKGNQRAMNEI